jgi:hypothetical protein
MQFDGRLFAFKKKSKEPWLMYQTQFFGFWEPWLRILRTALITTKGPFSFLITAQCWSASTLTPKVVIGDHTYD